MSSGWEHLCEAAKLYNRKSVFMREVRMAWTINDNTDIPTNKNKVKQ